MILEPERYELDAPARYQFEPLCLDVDEGFAHRVVALIRCAAFLMALTMRGYVPQRHTLRSINFAMSASVGFGVDCRKPIVAITMPGVQ